MEHIIRSRATMSVLVLAAGIFALGVAFAVAAYATLTPGGAGTSAGFFHASAWLEFSGAIIAWGAVCVAGWELVLSQSWEDVWDTAVGAAATLILAIGLLVNAASDGTGSAASVLVAVGVGLWAVLVLSYAARRSLLEGRSRIAGSPVEHQAGLWLAAACGLFVLAVGLGFTVQVTSKGTGIAAGVLEAAGTLTLLGVLAGARAQGYAASRAMPTVLGGLALLVAAFIATATVAGLVFGHDVSVTGLRIGVSIALTFEAAAVAALGIAAWMRLRDLVLGDPGR